MAQGSNLSSRYEDGSVFVLVLGGGQLHVRTKTLAPSSASGHIGNSWAETTFHGVLVECDFKNI